jgi:hypothetical protein
MTSKRAPPSVVERVGGGTQQVRPPPSTPPGKPVRARGLQGRPCLPPRSGGPESSPLGGAVPKGREGGRSEETAIAPSSPDVLAVLEGGVEVLERAPSDALVPRSAPSVPPDALVPAAAASALTWPARRQGADVDSYAVHALGVTCPRCKQPPGAECRELNPFTDPPRETRCRTHEVRSSEALRQSGGPPPSKLRKPF